KDIGTDYEYTVRELRLKFNPRGDVNWTRQIAAKSIEFVATLKPATGHGPWTKIFHDEKPLSLVLSAASPTGTVQNIKFTVPKDALKKADNAGISITDGDLLWPVSEDLR